MSAFPRLLYAHRGAPAELPENTIPSFRRAIERGATALETDAHMTSDGEIVLSHDESGARMANIRREIRRSPFREVERWDVGWGYRDANGVRPYAGQDFRIPTLATLLREFPSVPINVDVKQREPDMVAAIIALLHRTGDAERVRLASFSSRTLYRIRAAGYAGPTGLSQNEVVALYFAPSRVLERARDRFRYQRVAAQIPTNVGRIRLDSPAFIAKCHSLGLRVDYWTIDDPREATRLLAAGADGIMTDDPARVASAVV